MKNFCSLTLCCHTPVIHLNYNMIWGEMMSRRYSIIIHCVLPIFTGSIIYILFRPTSLLMFSWLEQLQLMHHVYYVRQMVNQVSSIPEIVVYSLPHALWTYSFMSSFYFVWKGQNSFFEYFWYMLVMIFSLGGEVGQALDFIPGTFDYFDLVLSLIACICPFIIIKLGGECYVFKKCKVKYL